MSWRSGSGGISRQRISPILVDKFYHICSKFLCLLALLICSWTVFCNYVELLVVADDRDRRKGGHLLLEGEFSLSLSVCVCVCH